MLNISCLEFIIKFSKILICDVRISDEREKHDPIGFRNTIIIGLENCSESLDFEAIYKFLDTSGSKLDYKRYGECLFDILIAGDLLGEFLLVLFCEIGFFAKKKQKKNDFI